MKISCICLLSVWMILNYKGMFVSWMIKLECNNVLENYSNIMIFVKENYIEVFGFL